jgi:hypothetical protein
VTPVAQGVRGADIHQVVVDARGSRCGAILWECKNAKNWSDGWIAKLKDDQRTLRADVAVPVTASLPRGCARFVVIDGVLVTDFTCAAPLAAIVRDHLLQLAQTRSAAVNKGEKLELLYRYLSGVEFRQRVEAIVEAFERMREDLDQERRAAERQWAKRTKQIEAVTFNISGMYGDLQAFPRCRRLRACWRCRQRSWCSAVHKGTQPSRRAQAVLVREKGYKKWIVRRVSALQVWAAP